jgi:hypothetical protein
VPRITLEAERQRVPFRLLNQVPPSATDASLDAASYIDSSSRRRDSAPIRKSFVRRVGAGPASSERPPLAQLFSGGRGGRVAILLYLAIIWRCSSEPYSTDKPARAWATLLDLEDPEGRGARRIAEAAKALQAARLVTLTPQPGFPNRITLLEESGEGRKYTLPSTAYSTAKAKGVHGTDLERHTYFKIAPEAWTEGHLQSLSGPAIALLLILLAERGGEGKPVWFSTDAFADRYRISHKSRAEGTKELERRGLLRVGRESLADNPRSTVYDTKRYRNIYHLPPLFQTD